MGSCDVFASNLLVVGVFAFLVWNVFLLLLGWEVCFLVCSLCWVGSDGMRTGRLVVFLWRVDYI